MHALAHIIICLINVVVQLLVLEMAKKDLVPLTKKCRLSLSLKKQTKVSELPQLEAMSSRFVTVDEKDLEVVAEGVVPINTAKDNAWATENSEWVEARNSSSDPLSRVPEDLLSCTVPHIV